MRLIPPSAVEQHYGIPTHRLLRWRSLGIGPEYFRLTARTIRYHTGYLDDWFNDPANAHLYTPAGHHGKDTQPGRAGRAG